jgi:hypothetical protein
VGGVDPEIIELFFVNAGPIISHRVVDVVTVDDEVEEGGY